MTRNEFVKMCGILGVSLPFASSLIACKRDDEPISKPLNPGEKVLIIGAGPAGMSTAYLLAQRGIEFEVLEALPSYGGRIKHQRNFSNFPISLGGEWMHVANSGTEILTEIVNDSSVSINTQTQFYDLQNDTSGYYDGNSLVVDTLGEHFGNDFVDKKFVTSSWLDFFETYILPSVQSKITYNTPINAIDYSGDQVVVRAQNGQTYSAAKVVVTVPVKILQSGMISFQPGLPSDKTDALNSIKVWGGFKAFFKFSTNFFPTYLSFPYSESKDGQIQYYDAAYAQNTSDNILGLFSTGKPAEPYQNLSGDAQRDYILNELDTIFGNKVATNNYIDHIVQNWNDEPYAKGAYVTAYESWRDVRDLGESVNDKLYFAGDGYTTGDDWSSVHAAARSARRAVEELVG